MTKRMSLHPVPKRLLEVTSLYDYKPPKAQTSVHVPRLPNTAKSGQRGSDVWQHSSQAASNPYEPVEFPAVFGQHPVTDDGSIGAASPGPFLRSGQHIELQSPGVFGAGGGLGY